VRLAGLGLNPGCTFRPAAGAFFLVATPFSFRFAEAAFDLRAGALALRVWIFLVLTVAFFLGIVGKGQWLLGFLRPQYSDSRADSVKGIHGKGSMVTKLRWMDESGGFLK
jgi:hypothetical protein